MTSRSIAVIKKKRYDIYMKKYAYLTKLIIVVPLVSCSLNNDLVVCPQLSAPIEGARAFVLTDKHQKMIDVRLNGVSAQCFSESDGNIHMKVKAGLKITRNLKQNANSDVASIPMMTAVLDSDDNVLSNETFGYKVGFDKELERLLPVVEFEMKVPSGGRAVISLTPSH